VGGERHGRRPDGFGEELFLFRKNILFEGFFYNGRWTSGAAKLVKRILDGGMTRPTWKKGEARSVGKGDRLLISCSWLIVGERGGSYPGFTGL